MFQKRIALICSAAIAALASSETTAKDLGFPYGEASPAMAMFVAQVQVASRLCVESGLVADPSMAAKTLKTFEASFAVRDYAAKDPDFASNLASATAKYQTAWEAASPDQRAAFCTGFDDEVAARRDSMMRYVAPMPYLQRYFAPYGEATARHVQTVTRVLSVAGAAAGAAASASAGQDAVMSASNGNFAASAAQLDTMRAASQISAGFGSMYASGNPIPVSSVMDVGEGRDRKVALCPLPTHFAHFDTPATEAVWMTYQRVSLPCRAPTPADLKQLTSSSS